MAIRKAALTLLLTVLCIAATGSDDQSAETFVFPDGGRSLYYQFQLDPGAPSETFVFVYGGSGCVDWTPYIPSYFEGLDASATIFALNKREVDEASLQDRCGPTFAQYNFLRQWVADYMEFISFQLGQADLKPRNVVLIGISEGSLPAVKVARSRTDITHLLIIGDGGWTMRRSLEELAGKDYVDNAWRMIAADANSLTNEWMGHPYRWWFDIMDLEATPDYLSLEIPILIGHGEADQSVPVQSSLSLKEAFEDAGKSNLTLRTFPNADHTLTAGEHNYRRELFEELSESLR